MQETKKYYQYFSSETINSLYNLWDEIGYNEEEKKIRLHQLVQRIQNVHSDFIEETLKKCQDLTRRTNEIKDKHIQKLEALGSSEEDIKHVKENEILGTIKDKYIDTLNNYNEFLDIYNQRVDDFKKYYVQIQSCFKEIGIIDTVPQCCNESEEVNNEEESAEQFEEEESSNEKEERPNSESNEFECNEPDNDTNENDANETANVQNKTHAVSGYVNQDNPQSQGEFSQIGEDDLTLERLKRFENKAKELQKEVDIRFGVFNEIKTKILKLQSDLCEVSPPEIDEMLNGHIYSDFVCDRLTDYQKYLSEIYDTRKKYISEMAVEIVKLWDILDVDETTRNQFLQTHSAFSQKNVQDCIDEAERLTQMRNERLPEIIEKMKKEISFICDDLSYSEEQKQQIFDKCDDDKSKDREQDMQYYEENKELFINIDDDEYEKESNNDDDEKGEIEEEEEVNDEEEIQESKQKQNQNKDNSVFVVVIEEEEEEKEEEDQIPLPEFEENVEETKNFIQIFNNYDAELYRLRKIHLVAQPIIDSIKQRQEMIDEYNNLMKELKQTNESSNKSTKTKEKTKSENQNKNKNKNKDMATTEPVKKKKNIDDQKRTDQLNGQIELQTVRVRPPNAQDKIYQEKVIRRYKNVLPRLERKLLIMLIQFREDNGEDFIWNQKPIINELKHIHVTQSEIKAQSKSKKVTISAVSSLSYITYNANLKQRKSLEPSKKKMDVNAKKSRNQRKSTIPKNPNI